MRGERLLRKPTLFPQFAHPFSKANKDVASSRHWDE
jgi:hypothetical protein